MSSGLYHNPNRVAIEQARLKKQQKLQQRSERDELLARISSLENRIDELEKVIHSFTYK
jgi:hypothetical protein